MLYTEPSNFLAALVIDFIDFKEKLSDNVVNLVLESITTFL